MLKACVDSGVFEMRRIDPVVDGMNARAEYTLTDYARSQLERHGFDYAVQFAVDYIEAHYKSQDGHQGQQRGGTYHEVL
jgi:hypothetical protein